MSSGELLVYIDGEFVPRSQAKVSVFDHGLLYGDGVFEGIRSYNGVVFRLIEHIDRLYDSAKTIMLDIPITKQEMVNVVLETLRKNKLKDAYIRLVVTRGVGDLGLDPRK
ncbi:MAG: aminotransferase class IV, partial [Nitrososphaerota archaeon]